MKNNIKKLLAKGRIKPMMITDKDGKYVIIGFRRQKSISKKANRFYWLDEPIEVTLDIQKTIGNIPEVKENEKHD